MANTNNTAHINMRVDGEIKDKAQELFASLGMDMTTAINIFLRQAIRKNGIPFEITSERPAMRSKAPQLGCLKGQIWEADDHDWFEPMEDFKEYM